MARSPRPLSHALYADLVILDEFGRALFRDLTEFITEKSFASTRELADAIIAFLAARNDNPRRYVWKAKGEDILRKIDAARQALAALKPASNAVSETAHYEAYPGSPRAGAGPTNQSSFARRH